MKKAFKLMLVSVAAVAVLTACASPPTEELTVARGAIDGVVSEGAEKYTPEELQKVRKKMDEALAEIKIQDGYSFSNYSLAKFTLAQVAEDCGKLKGKIAQRKEEMKVAAGAALAEAQSMLAEAKTILDNAPKRKGSLADIDALRNAVAGLEAELQGVPSQIDAGEYIAAVELARTVSSRAMTISTDVRASQERVAVVIKK